MLDTKLSDVVPSGSASGGAQMLNLTESGVSFSDSNLIGATVYLLFADGIQFTQVTAFTSLVAKEFKFDPLTGTVTFSYSIDDPVGVTIFYTSTATAAIPGVEPVTVAEVKDYCKIDTGSQDDTLLAELITTAREQAEDFTGLSIVNRTVTAVLNNSCGGIFLPYCPFISLLSIKDSDGAVIDTGDYILSGMMFPQLITPTWDRLTLVYTAGYGIPPSRIITAIKQQVFFLYENRGENPLINRGQEAAITLSPQARATLQRIRRV